MDRRRNAVYLIIAISLLAGLATGRGFFFTLAYVFGGILLLAFLWTAASVSWLRITRQTQVRRAQVGQTLVEQFTVHNTSMIPKLWLEIYDQSTLPGHSASHVIGGVGPKGREIWVARTLCTQRGEYRLGPLTVVTGDPFGLFHVERTFEATSRLVVYPPMFPITEFDLPIGLLPGGDALRRRTHHVTANASGVRDYAPGDSFNRIHWRTTARRDRLMVKEFELDPLTDIWIVLDGERAAHTGYPSGGGWEAGELPVDLHVGGGWIPPATEEYAVAAAASLAMHFIGRGRAVGFITHTNRREVFQVDRGARQLTKILETLAVLAADGTHTLAQVLDFEDEQLPRGATVILVTPSTRLDWISEAQRLEQRGLRVVAVLVDGQSFGGHPGIQQVAIQLAASRIPSTTVQLGDNLSIALSTRRY